MTMQLTYIKQAGEPVGDGGDQYTGLDRFGRVIDQRWLDSSGADIERVDYGFTAASNRQWRQNRVASGGQDEFYQYDGLYQVADLQRGTLNSTKTAISGTPSWQEDFTYDPIGNWDAYLTKVSGVTNLDQSRTHNRANELTEIDGSSATVAEDAAGNMVKVPQVGDWSTANELVWDAWNRLVEVKAGSTTVATYRYDGNTRRTTKTTADTRHYYYSDQWQIMEERVDAGTTVERQFVWGQRFTDDLVLRDRGDEHLYVLGDYFSPTAIANTSETVLERYGYDAFGLSRVMAPDFSGRTASLYDWETRYAMYRWDQETGLYQVRYRYLHPTLGRWGSRDPIGEKGGVNLYGFVHNDPINSVDIFGLDASTPSSTITPWQLGWEWLTGNGPRHRDFGPGDYMTEGLRQHGHIKDSIDRMKTDIFFRCQSCKNGDFTKSYPYSLAGWQGVPKYLYDYSTLGTGGMTGNLVVTYLGSYSLDITASDIKCSIGTAKLSFLANNSSSAVSATRPPVLGYTQWWQNNIAPYINQWFQNGGMSTTTQTFRWTENVSFDANHCCVD